MAGMDDSEGSVEADGNRLVEEEVHPSVRKMLKKIEEQDCRPQKRTRESPSPKGETSLFTKLEEMMTLVRQENEKQRQVIVSEIKKGVFSSYKRNGSSF